jgi:hypothetical protein
LTFKQKIDILKNMQEETEKTAVETPAPKKRGRKPKNIVKSRSRNEDGLIEGLEYHYNEDKTINWKKMVPEEFLVPNAQKTNETDISKLEDHELLILLGGLRYLAKIRGYYSVGYDNLVWGNNEVSVACRINWMPNFETEDISIIYEALGSANGYTTTGFGVNYKTEIAENRSFCRNVRTFLGINILSKDELLANRTEETNTDDTVLKIMRELMEQKKIGFEKLKNRLGDKYQENKTEYPELQNWESFTCIEDFPDRWVRELIKSLKRKKEN